MSAENDAQRWHDENRDLHLAQEEYGSCWCCCFVCDIENPHFWTATTQLRAEES